MLSQYNSSGRDSSSKETEPVGGVEELEAMVSSMKMFMGKVSSHEGAEFPWCEQAPLPSLTLPSLRCRSASCACSTRM